MPDVVNRDAKEAALAKAVSKEFSIAVKELLILFPEMEEFIATVPIEFWTAQQIALVSAIAPQLLNIYVAQAETMIDDLVIYGVDWALVNEAAADWASTYTFDLVGGINNTSRAALQKLIPAFFEEGMTLAQLRDRLSSIYGPTRAELIASTETTRAASEGEQEVSKRLAEQGINMQPIWLTMEDEIVRQCPVCWPKNNKKIGVEIPDEYPPAHPRCRCSVVYEMIPLE